MSLPFFFCFYVVTCPARLFCAGTNVFLSPESGKGRSKATIAAGKFLARQAGADRRGPTERVRVGGADPRKRG